MFHFALFVALWHNPLLAVVFILGFLLFKKTPWGEYLLRHTFKLIGAREEEAQLKIRQNEHELRLKVKEHDQLEKLADVKYAQDIHRIERHNKREEELEEANHKTAMETAVYTLDRVTKSMALYDAAIQERMDKKDYTGVLFSIPASNVPQYQPHYQDDKVMDYIAQQQNTIVNNLRSGGTTRITPIEV